MVGAVVGVPTAVSAAAGAPTRSIMKLIVPPETEVTVTLTSNASPAFVAVHTID